MPKSCYHLADFVELSECAKMNCINFFDRDLEENISCPQTDSNSTLVFLHVPKTAGTSAQRDLNYVFPDGIHIPQESKEQHWKATLDRLSKEHIPLIRGHLNSRHLMQIRECTSSVRAMTYLRHPVDRIISNYLWQHANHRNSPTQFSSPGSFEEFCALKSTNQVCELLVGPCSSTEEAMDKLADQFWFIGLTEYYHVCQAVLLNLLGSNYRMRKRQNVTKSQPSEMELITQHGLEVAQAGMEIDLAVYQFFNEKWSARLNDAIERLMRVVPQPKLKQGQNRKPGNLQAA